MGNLTEKNIPKIIHYCWFGRNELPMEAIKCIESWKKYCPEYQIIKWDENNYDYTKNRYMHEAYQNHKWAFVTDYARLDVIYRYGGVYLDTDVELIRPLDDLLENTSYAGLEDAGRVNFGLGFGSVKSNDLIKEILGEYDNVRFVNIDGTLNMTPCPVFQSNVLKRHGLSERNEKQYIYNMHIFPTEYFCPFDYKTGVKKITCNTYSIHHFTASWVTKKQADFRRVWLACKNRKLPTAVCYLISYPYRVAIVFENCGIRGMLELIIIKIFGQKKRNNERQTR